MNYATFAIKCFFSSNLSEVEGKKRSRKNFKISKKIFFPMTKKVRPICHSTRLDALYPTVEFWSSEPSMNFELNYRSNYSCVFDTLTRYISRQTHATDFPHPSFYYVPEGLSKEYKIIGFGPQGKYSVRWYW